MIEWRYINHPEVDGCGGKALRIQTQEAVGVGVALGWHWYGGCFGAILSLGYGIVPPEYLYDRLPRDAFGADLELAIGPFTFHLDCNLWTKRLPAPLT